MDTLEAIAKRKSTRSYKPEKISEEALQTILKAANASPVSMGNYASLHITVVEDPTALNRINTASTEALRRIGIEKNADYGAKTMVLISSTPVHRPGAEYTNGGIVVENMVLAATALGIDSVILGSAPVAVEQDPSLMAALQIPEGFTPLVGVLFGYGTEDTPVKEHSISVSRI